MKSAVSQPDKWREVKAYTHCFVCGEQNLTGLRIKFYSDGKITRAEYTPSEHFSGYKDIFHGGVMAAILDEVMIKTLIANDWVAVTREMSITYKRPARLGEKIHLEGEISSQKKKLVATKGKAINSEGEILAEAEGKYFIVEGEFKEKLLESLKR